jgi:probable F420-dependent oxidoreductase
VLSNYVEQLRNYGVPSDRIIVAALRAKVLRLSGDRAAGALPYFTTVQHTKKAREILGDGPTLAVVQSFVTGTDRGMNRSLVRDWAKTYLNMENYVNNLREAGFPELAVGAEPTDELLDALAPLGGADQAAARAEEHLSAGADHVPVYPVDASEDPVPSFELFASLIRGAAS